MAEESQNARTVITIWIPHDTNWPVIYARHKYRLSPTFSSEASEAKRLLASRTAASKPAMRAAASLLFFFILVILSSDLCGRTRSVKYNHKVSFMMIIKRWILELVFVVTCKSSLFCFISVKNIHWPTDCIKLCWTSGVRTIIHLSE